MMKGGLRRSFYSRDTRIVARDLIGREFVRTIGNKKLHGVIIETEAYHGFQDRASHACKGKTMRNAPMFEKPGTMYVYLVYGIHWCLNLVTMQKNFPAAVLIRGVYLPKEDRKLDGPGKVTRYFQVDNKFNNKDIFTSKELSIGRKIVQSPKIHPASRIGIEYAGIWSKKPWRYLLQ